MPHMKLENSVCMYICVHICSHTHMHICACIHAYTHTYIYYSPETAGYSPVFISLSFVSKRSARLLMKRLCRGGRLSITADRKAKWKRILEDSLTVLGGKVFVLNVKVFSFCIQITVPPPSSSPTPPTLPSTNPIHTAQKGKGLPWSVKKVCYIALRQDKDPTLCNWAEQGILHSE